MTARTRVPRASLAVSMLRDSDYIGLFRTKDGRSAFAIFVALVMRAKDTGNNGRFSEPIAVIAEAIRTTPDSLLKSISLIHKTCRLNGNLPWLVTDGNDLIIRNYDTWNPPERRGGVREGAGRPTKPDSNGIQSDTPPQEGIGNGLGSSPGGGAGGTKPTSSELYLARDFSAELWAGLPNQAKTGPNTITAAIATAMQDYGVEGQKIVDRTLAFYRSPMGRAEYYRSTKPANFIARGGYNEPDSAWKDPNAKPATGSTTPVYDESAAVKRRAQDDAVRQQYADDPGALARAAAEYKEQHTNDNANA